MSNHNTMKAIQIAKFGGPEVCQYVDVPIPECGEDQVLVKIAVTGINYLDIPIGSYDANFSEKIKGRLSFSGLRLLYRRYYKDTRDNGIYAETGLELIRISAYSQIKLSQINWDKY